MTERENLPHSLAILGRRLVASDKAVQFVANSLRNDGLIIEAPHPVMSPTTSQTVNFRDGGDIWIIGPFGARFRVEIKNPKRSFISLRDWQPQCSMVILQNAESFDLLKEKPFAYVIVNEHLTHCIVVNVKKTRPLWDRKLVYDKYAMERYMVYCVKNELAVFCNVGSLRDNLFSD